MPDPFEAPLGEPSTVSEDSKRIPQEAFQAAVAAYTCAWVSGVWRHEELVSVVLEAAAPGIAAQARAEALRDAIDGRVTLDEQAAAQGHTGPQRIEDLSSSLPFSEADVAAFFSAMEDRGPTYEEDLRADERRKTITSLRDRMGEISGANLKDQGNRLWITTYGEIAAWLDRQLDEQTGEDQ